MEFVAYGKENATEAEKAMAKEFLDADKAAGRYQLGYAGIVAMIVEEDSKIVLLWHNKADCWTFPTGKIEDDEADYEAVEREGKEELGIEVKGTKMLGSITIEVKPHDNLTFHVYKVTSYNEEVKNKEPHKHARLKKVTKVELKAMAKQDTASELIKQAIEKGYL
jgi:8-oxo-dGTP pyrophosphatase MutT (NUDIX family)